MKWMLLLLTSCHPLSNDPLLAGPCQGGTGEFYPLEEGAWWLHDERLLLPNELVLKCKLVVVEPLAEIPFRPGLMGWPASSLSYNIDSGEYRLGRRWQDVDGCSVRRHVDEWFIIDHRGTNREQVDIYCPFKSRVHDCPGACEGRQPDVESCSYGCEGSTWSEDYSILTVTAPGKDPSKEVWDACLAVDINLLTCETQGEIPEGCSFERKEKNSIWRVEATGETIEVPAGRFDTMREGHQVRDAASGEWGTWDYFNWARGVGKIREYQTEVEDEVMLSYCLGSQGCTEPPPSAEDLVHACTQ